MYVHVYMYVYMYVCVCMFASINLYMSESKNPMGLTGQFKRDIRLHHLH